MHNGVMSLRLRLIVASAQLVLAVAGTVIFASQIETTYFLPPDSTGVAVRQTALFAPAVAGTVAGLFVVVVLTVHLVVVVRRDPPRWVWVATGVLALLAVCAPFLVAALDRGTY